MGPPDGAAAGSLASIEVTFFRDCQDCSMRSHRVAERERFAIADFGLSKSPLTFSTFPRLLNASA
jgi:hypothetical protein